MVNLKAPYTEPVDLGFDYTTSYYLIFVHINLVDFMRESFRNGYE